MSPSLRPGRGAACLRRRLPMFLPECTWEDNHLDTPTEGSTSTYRPSVDSLHLNKLSVTMTLSGCSWLDE